MYIIIIPFGTDKQTQNSAIYKPPRLHESRVTHTPASGGSDGGYLIPFNYLKYNYYKINKDSFLNFIEHNTIYFYYNYV